jgi:hypothetical protein
MTKKNEAAFEAMNRGSVELETIKLNHGVEVDGVLIKDLKLRRPKVKDFTILDSTAKNKSETEKSVTLISNLSIPNIPIDAIEELDFQDFLLLTNKLGEYLAVQDK